MAILEAKQIKPGRVSMKTDNGVHSVDGELFRYDSSTLETKQIIAGRERICVYNDKGSRIKTI